ncbi:MAG TPA: alpha/beta fold hydrolase [Actinomycetota bacterium]|nr:alpha/beta fold hydrolase [Actinomycetota bacterium]
MPIAQFDDICLHYEVHGNAAKPAVVGIMGLALDQRFWAGQIPAVTATHSFITFDNRGLGGSTGPEATSVDDMVTDTIRVLDHLEIERAVMFGASMGGTIAQRIALDHPERVSGLVLAVTWARPIEFMRRQVDLGRMVLRAGGSDAFARAGAVRMFTPQFFEFGAEMIDGILQTMQEPGTGSAELVLQAQLNAIEKHDALAELSRIGVPTLVLGGKMDQMAPFFASEEIAAAIPAARLVAFETGHALMVEEMDAFNTAVSEFLAAMVE